MASVMKVSMASVGMGCAVTVTNQLILRSLGMTRTAFLADIAISIPVGMLVFYVFCRQFGVAELDPAMRALRGPVARLFRRVSR